MNTTIPVIHSSGLSCPLDERRKKTELLVKLFVVHFTTIGAFFHLLSLRGEYLLTLRPIFYICAPLSFIAQHIIAAAALIIYIPLVCAKQRRYPNIEKDLISPIKWLLAKFEVPSTEPVSQSELESGNSRASRNGLGERAIRRLGRVLVTIAFLVQCSLSLLLYYRRKAHGPNSIALIDEKIFQLAASGILVGLLTIGATLRFPGFRLSNPAWSSSSTKIEKIMICLGHRRAPCVRPLWIEDAIVNAIIGFFALSVISCLTLHAAGSIHPFQEARCLLGLDKPQDCPDNIHMNLLILPLLLSLSVTALVGCLLTSAFFLLIWLCMGGGSLICMASALFIFCAILILVGISTTGLLYYVLFYGFFYPCYLIVGVIQTIYVGITDYSGIFAQLNEWKDWPVDTACPFLWKDSMEEQVWWLA